MRPRTVRLASLLLLGALAACGSGTATGGAGLQLLPDEDPLPAGVTERDRRINYHDFGHVPDGENVKHVFRMRNTDPREVAVTRVIPGCGCTVASLRVVRADGSIVPGEPISSKAAKLLVVAPGEIAELEVRMSTGEMRDETKNTDKLVTLSVSTDSPNGYFLNLEVHIYVDKPFNVVPGAIALGAIPANGGGERSVQIVGVPPQRAEIKELLPPPAGVHASLVKELRGEVPVWTLNAGLDPPLELGPRTEVLHLATESKPGVPGRELQVPLTAQVVPDLAADPSRLVFAASPREARSGEALLRTLLAGQRLRVTSIDVPAAAREQFEVRFEPVDPDAGGSSPRWKITLTSRPPLEVDKILSGKLLVHLDDPQHPSFELEYVVHVK